ncbi:hypothetical protein [Nocardioides pacificus]
MAAGTKRRRKAHPVERKRRTMLLQGVGLTILIVITAFLVFKALTVNG